MFKTIVNLFGRSPFAPIESHMEKVMDCVRLLPELFAALEAQQEVKVEEITQQISSLEHQADLLKDDIRNHLPKSLFLPVDRANLLEILALQDQIADCVEDIAVLSTLKLLTLPKSLWPNFYLFLTANSDAFLGARAIIKEMHELLESSFGGVEAQKVRAMVDAVACKEQEVDLLQRKLLKALFREEAEVNMSSLVLWLRIFEKMAAISNLSESLANRIRLMLELK